MNILDFVMVGSNDYEKSSEFYDVILQPLKLKKTLKTEKYIGYSHLGEPEKVIFYITNPVNGKPATFGNGTQITLLADSKEAVEKYSGKIIARSANNVTLEGREMVRVALAEFPDIETAKKCYNSEEYVEARKHLENNAVREHIIFEGI